MVRRLPAFFAVLLATTCFGTFAHAAAKTFTCAYETYSDQQGNHKVDKPFRLTFSVDLKTNKAYRTGSGGSSEVEIIPNTAGFSLLEFTGNGNIMVTFITNGGPSTHNFTFATALGDIAASQYYGTCK